MKFLVLFSLLFLPKLATASIFGSSKFGNTSVSKSPAIINVSGWDPKEVQRAGERFSDRNVSALKRNGALGLIARSAKGSLLDDKFANFMASAHREGLLLGAYHFVTMDVNPVVQADQFVSRVRAIAAAKGIRNTRILLVGDYDTNSTPERLVSFILRVHQRTGIFPVTYLENSDGLRARLSQATEQQKTVIRRTPYWIALYGPGGTERVMSNDELTPDDLCKSYGIWKGWSMWQYGGVIWQNGRSQAKHYDTRSWRSPRFFGNLSQPTERNVFRGDKKSLLEFWQRHSISL